MQKSEGCAKLIYGDKDMEQELNDFGLRVHVNNKTIAIKKMGTDEVYLVTDLELMRSFDYGTEAQKGVSLLMTKYPMNNRLLTQALGRVGRGLNDTCQRFKYRDL